MVGDHVAAGRLVQVLDDWTPPFAGYHLYYPSRRHASPAFSLLVSRCIGRRCTFDMPSDGGKTADGQTRKGGQHADRHGTHFAAAQIARRAAARVEGMGERQHQQRRCDRQADKVEQTVGHHPHNRSIISRSAKSSHGSEPQPA